MALLRMQAALKYVLGYSTAGLVFCALLSLPGNVSGSNDTLPDVTNDANQLCVVQHCHTQFLFPMNILCSLTYSYGMMLS